MILWHGVESLWPIVRKYTFSNEDEDSHSNFCRPTSRGGGTLSDVQNKMKVGEVRWGLGHAQAGSMGSISEI